MQSLQFAIGGRQENGTAFDLTDFTRTGSEVPDPSVTGVISLNLDLST
jgi:hypothetical protein